MSAQKVESPNNLLVSGPDLLLLVVELHIERSASKGHTWHIERSQALSNATLTGQLMYNTSIPHHVMFSFEFEKGLRI